MNGTLEVSRCTQEEPAISILLSEVALFYGTEVVSSVYIFKNDNSQFPEIHWVFGTAVPLVFFFMCLWFCYLTFWMFLYLRYERDQLSSKTQWTFDNCTFCFQPLFKLFLMVSVLNRHRHAPTPVCCFLFFHIPYKHFLV